MNVNNNLGKKRELMSHGNAKRRLFSQRKSNILKDNYDDPPICDLFLSREK